MTDDTQPEALRALAEAAKWTGKWYDAGCNTVYCTYDKADSILHDEIAHPVPFGVSGYIAAAHPQAVIALLDRIAELESELEAIGAGGVQALSAAPAGWKLVPVEPTQEMLRAATEHSANCGGMASGRSYYTAMLAASPTPPAKQQAAPKTAPVKACVCGEPQAPGTVHRVDGPCYVAAPQQAPAPLSDDAKDAARYRWLRATTNFATNSQGERIDVRNQPDKWDSAIDAAIAAQGGKV